MSSELIAKLETVAVSISKDKINKKTTTDTHGIGDSVEEKLPTPPASRDNFIDLSQEPSYPSCPSFKAICRAWKNRANHNSGSNLEKRNDDLDLKMESLFKKLETTENADECKKVPRSVSMSVMMESRPLELTESSEESSPNISIKHTQRFLTPQEIREAFDIFKLCDENNDSYIELSELKLALEKLSVPQTHLAAKEIMAKIVGENITKLNYCQFLLAYAAMLENRTINENPNNTSQIEIMKKEEEATNISKKRVSDAKHFFESKIAEQISKPINMNCTR